MDKETKVLDDLKELLNISRFMINRKKFKKDVKNIKKVIHKISDNGLDSVTVESVSDYD
jgi:hypothetical protein